MEKVFLDSLWKFMMQMQRALHLLYQFVRYYTVAYYL